MKMLLQGVILAMGALLVYFAFIGMIFMLVAHKPTSTNTCDKVVDDWCMAKVHKGEDIRIQRTFNPQETINGKELQ